MQAFKVMVNDPNSVLDTLTREITEVGPDGQEVVFNPIMICIYLQSSISFTWSFTSGYSFR